MRTKILIAVGATLVVTLAGAAVWAQVGFKSTVVLQGNDDRDRPAPSVPTLSEPGDMNRGSTPLKLLVVFAGEEGKPNLVRP